MLVSIIIKLIINLISW